MRQSLLFLSILLLAVSNGFSQQIVKLADGRPHPLNNSTKTSHFARATDTAVRFEKCGFSYILQRAESRGFNNTAFENEIGRLVQRKLAQGRVNLDGTVTVPIIFHVVYRTADVLSTSSANLSTSLFQAQVNQLNIDYANGAGSIWAVAANVPIRFCMALVDTAGRPLTEPGIDRINGQLRGWSNTNTQGEANLINNFDNTIKPASIWDPYSYVNVWTASMNTSGLLGYSTFPSLSTLQGLDNAETNLDAGVVIAWQSVGSVASPGSSSAYGFGRTLTHELGHFFGLRHIWGDADCGNDYCGDTPTQFDETSGCPTTDTLTNCTPLVRKMYENYMDYSNDACLNTFTSDQSLRTQAVMDNSPRRMSLIASKACQARAANAISFATAVPQAVSETGTGGCPNVRSYTFRLYVSSAATNAATVTFSTSGSAIAGKDFIVSPASVTYAAGDNSVKTVTVTIIDDQVAEPDKTFVLNYSISGNGVVAGPDKQALTLTIFDDDIIDNISIDNLQPLKYILTQDFDSSSGTIPTGWKTEAYYARTDTTYNQWTVSANGGNGTIGRAAHITNDTTLKPNTYNNSNETDAYLFTPLVDASTLRDLNLVFKWRCRGESGFDAGYIGYVLEGQPPTAANVVFFTSTFGGQGTNPTAARANLNLPASLSGKKFYFVFNWYNDDNTGNNPGFTVDSIVLTGKAYAVATTADADTTFAHYSGQTVTYFSKPTALPVTNRIIAKVSGMNTDAGCITASVLSAGSGRILVNNGAFYRTAKVMQLTPATAVPGASYTITLYYTPDELAIWGGQAPSLKIMKLKETALIDGPYQSDDFQVGVTTFTDNSTAGYYTYTATFSDGFSRFMLVDANASPLPVSLLSFTAKPRGKTILLNWTTSQEINNKGFALERSADGINFSRIGWVNGKGTTSVQTDYAYTDHFVQPNVLYYYRLRQTDTDNKEKLSGIEQARIQDVELTVTVSPVPARDYVQVFVFGVQQPAALRLLNAQGQVVRQWPAANVFNQGFRIDVSGLASGVYMLKIDLPSQQVVKKITVER